MTATSAAVPQPPVQTQPSRRASTMQVLVLLLAGIVLGEVFRPAPVHATSNPLAVFVSPTAPINLVANVPATLPKPAGFTGAACTIVFWNPTATPVYFGGVSPGVGAVTVAGGMPACTDAAVCITGPVSSDVRTLALVAGVNVNGIRYVFGSGC